MPTLYASGENLKNSDVKKWFSWNKRHGFMITANPLDLKPAQRSKEFARLQAAIAKFILKLKPGVPDASGQWLLFDQPVE